MSLVVVENIMFDEIMFFIEYLLLMSKLMIILYVKVVFLVIYIILFICWDLTICVRILLFILFLYPNDLYRDPDFDNHWGKEFPCFVRCIIWYHNVCG